MPVPTWTPGQILTASDVNTWFVPIVARKASTQSVTNSTALVNDNDLNFPVVASATYWVMTSIIFTAAAGGDLQLNWSSNATGLNLAGAINYRNISSAATVHGFWTTGSVIQLAGSGSGTNLGMTAFGSFTTSSTPGTFRMQFAQNTSSAIATSIQAGSLLLAYRIG